MIIFNSVEDLFKIDTTNRLKELFFDSSELTIQNNDNDILTDKLFYVKNESYPYSISYRVFVLDTQSIMKVLEGLDVFSFSSDIKFLMNLGILELKDLFTSSSKLEIKTYLNSTEVSDTFGILTFPYVLYDYIQEQYIIQTNSVIKILGTLSVIEGIDVFAIKPYIIEGYVADGYITSLNISIAQYAEAGYVLNGYANIAIEWYLEDDYLEDDYI